MSYTVKMQKPASYANNSYGSGTIGSSACGPAALCNCLANGGIADISVPTMCKLAVSCGARQTGGTVESVLLKAAGSKYGFTYCSTSKNTELLAHLKAGGTAICYCGGGYPLFSVGGHYVAAVGVDSSGKIVIADSLYYANKWTYNSTRKSQITTTSTRGLVMCSITALGKATADRSPSYFLISKKTAAPAPEKPQSTETTEKTQEDDDMIYKTINDVPEWYRPTVQKCIDNGGIKGAGNGELNLTESECRTLTILDNMSALGSIAPVVYKTIDDVPSYYKAAVQKLIDRGAIAGTGNGELNISEDICRSMTILDNAHLLDAVTAADVDVGEMVEEN
ncbi:MAG: S-layer homology domain-containing protein [Eubacteriales bacterium]|nr:S-layer homology domain-containing protein [Eubacteriales bacterium]